MKRTISILLALMLLVSTGVSAFADDTVYSEGKLYYTISDGAVTIVGAFGSDEVITIPSSIAGYPVSTIAEGAFTSRTNLKTLNLPDTITTVEEGAVPSGVTLVYNSAASREGDSGTEPATESGTESTPVPPVTPTVNPTSAPASSTSPAATAAPAESTPYMEYIVTGVTEYSDEENQIPDTVEVTEEEFEEEPVIMAAADGGEAESPAPEADEPALEQAEESSSSPAPFIIIGVLAAAAIAAAVIILKKKKQ